MPTTPTAGAPKSSRRKYIFLIAALILVTAGWTAAWFYGRTILAGQLDGQMARMAENGLEISCSNLAIAGFPFRYEVACNDLQSSDRRGAEGSLGALNAVALIYNPWHVIFEAKSPAAVAVPLSGLSGDVTWKTARASIKFSKSSLGSLDAVVEEPEAAFENPFARGLFAADKTEVHLRDTPDLPGTLEGFATIDGLQLKSVPELAKPLNLRGHVRVEGGTPLLSGAGLIGLVQAHDGALPVRLMLAEASLGQSRASANGDLTLNGDGTVSGTLEVAVANADNLLTSLKPLFPQEDNSYALLENVIKSLEPAAQEVDGVRTIKLPMVIDRGLVRVGFLPLGQIPPLFQAGI